MRKKYRLVEILYPPFEQSWKIEKKSIFGFWYEPELTYGENATYYNYIDAKKQYDFLTGKTSIKRTILEESN